MEILNDMSILMTLVVGGTVVLVAFLWLVTFSQRDIFIVGAFWLSGGVLCALIYLFLVSYYSLRGPIIIFSITLLTGLVQFLPLSMMEPTNKWIRRWIPYVVWLYFWVTALIGWRYGWLGLLTISLPALLIAGAGLFFVAGFLLPFPEQDLYRGKRPAPAAGDMPTFGQEILDLFALLRYPENRELLKQRIDQRRKALRCLLTYTLGTHYPYYVVIDEKIAERTEGTRTWMTEEEKLVKWVDGDSFGAFLSGPGIVLTGCDQAVVLSTGLKFKGAKGPGVIFTDMSDNPAHIIDLRGQLCAFPVRAWTKDGIEVELVTFIPFQIGTGKGKPALRRGFPYRSSDVFKAVHAQLVEHVDPSQVPENLKQHEWYDLPQVVGERIVREIISRYEFDELYAPFELHEDAGQHPRSQISEKLGKKLDQVLPDWGIQRIGSGIGNLEPVDKRVIEQRIEAWRADWAREIMLKQAAGQSRRLRMVEQARAQAQIDLILAIGKQIERLQVVGAPIPMDAVACYFIEVLEKLAGRPALRQFLPIDTGNILQRARGAIATGREGG